MLLVMIEKALLEELLVGRDLHLPVKLTLINIPDQWYVAIYNIAIEGFISYYINYESLVMRSWPSWSIGLCVIPRVHNTYRGRGECPTSQYLVDYDITFCTCAHLPV